MSLSIRKVEAALGTLMAERCHHCAALGRPSWVPDAGAWVHENLGECLAADVQEAEVRLVRVARDSQDLPVQDPPNAFQARSLKRRRPAEVAS